LFIFPVYVALFFEDFGRLRLFPLGTGVGSHIFQPFLFLGLPRFCVVAGVSTPTIPFMPAAATLLILFALLFPLRRSRPQHKEGMYALSA